MIFVIGANPTVEPSGGRDLDEERRQARREADRRRSAPQRSRAPRRRYYLQFKPDTDVALLNAMLHVIVEEGLVDEAFIRDRTIGLRGARRERRRASRPEAMAPICGIDAETIREVARLYATSKGSMILWGMGISQHVHGTDNARCLIALALIDRPDRQARHRACIRCAARTTCRARPTPG